MGKRPLNYKTDLQIAIGQYCQAYDHKIPHNDLRTRMLDTIYLRPLDNAQGGHELMDLNTKQAITRPLRDVEVVPITPNVIKAVEQLAFDKGFSPSKSRTELELSFMPAIGLQEWTTQTTKHQTK